MDQGDETVKTALKVFGWFLAVALITLYTFRTPDTDAREMAAKYAAPPSKFLLVEGDRAVHIRDEGPRDAPVIVLLHGSNADLHTWEPWVQALTGRYRVIRYDQFGHGLTGPHPRGEYTPAAFAETLGQVADKLGLKQFTLAGNSMGGGIALAYALKHPERLSALVLVDAAGAPVTQAAKGNIGFTLARTPGISWVMGQVTPRALVERSLRQSVSNQTIVTEAMIDRYWELLRYPGNRQATMQRFATPRVPYTTQQLAGLKVPTLVIWGEEDALIPFAAGQLFAQTIPGAKLVAYPGIGHLPHEEAAARSAADLQAFLAAQGIGGKVG